MNIEDIEIEINPEYTMMKKLENGLYLSQEQIDILKTFNIDYKSCSNLSELIRIIEEYLDESDEDVLNNLLDILEERNYYENYNK